MKPQQIIELEKELGFELEETKNVDDIFNSKESKTYLLNDIQEVIGLNLYSCNLKDIYILQNLYSLISLNLKDNQISDVSPLKKLVKLTNLQLWGNQVSDISFLQGLSNLKSLNLNNNPISNISFLQSLTCLVDLSLWLTQVSDYSFLQNLINLEELDLGTNRVSDYSFLQNLTSLKRLNLSSTQTFPTYQILKNYTKTNLESLELTNNILDYFFLQNLKSLERLDLSGNLIGNCSLSFLNSFPRLEELYLEGNPIQNIPEEIFNRGECLKELRTYFHDGEKYGWDKNKDLKIILVGNGNVGKTSLINRLVDNFFDENYKSTHGIQLREYKDIAPYNINIWDFGGQDIYHATHRLFMQTRALFLVVWDWETEKEPAQKIEENNKINEYQNYDLDYWLNYVDVLGKGSKAIVIQTKSQKHGEKKHLKENELREKYQNIWLDSISIDSKIDDWDLNGFEALKVAIRKAIKTTDLLRKEQLPKNWIAQRESIHNLLNEGKQTIDYDDFVKEMNKGNPLSPDTILGWLSDSGAVFYQKNLFDNQVIIDQQWAINAIYTLFDRNKTFYRLTSRSNGKFNTEDLNEAWKEKKYGEEEKKLFLSFMESCEICFELTDYNTPFEQKEFIAPALCNGQKPNATDEFWRNQKNCLHFGFQYQFLHYGNIQSFIVQTGKDAQENGLWKYGIWAKSGGHNFLVEAFPEKKQILISVTGVSVSHNKEKLGEIRKQFEHIHSIKNVIRYFISIDGKEFVWYDECNEQRRLGNPYVKSWSGKSLEVNDFMVFLVTIIPFVTGGGEELQEPTILEPKKSEPMEFPQDFIDELEKQLEKEYTKMKTLTQKRGNLSADLRKNFDDDIKDCKEQISFIKTEFLEQHQRSYKKETITALFEASEKRIMQRLEVMENKIGDVKEGVDRTESKVDVANEKLDKIKELQEKVSQNVVEFSKSFRSWKNKHWTEIYRFIDEYLLKGTASNTNMTVYFDAIVTWLGTSEAEKLDKEHSRVYLMNAEFLSRALINANTDDYSAAILQYCRVVEFEFVNKIIKPFVEKCKQKAEYSDYTKSIAEKNEKVIEDYKKYSGEQNSEAYLKAKGKKELYEKLFFLTDLIRQHHYEFGAVRQIIEYHFDTKLIDQNLYDDLGDNKVLIDLKDFLQNHVFQKYDLFSNFKLDDEAKGKMEIVTKEKGINSKSSDSLISIFGFIHQYRNPSSHDGIMVKDDLHNCKILVQEVLKVWTSTLK